MQTNSRKHPPIKISDSDPRPGSQAVVVDATNRGLQPGGSRESLGQKPGKPDRPLPNPNKTKKPPTYTGKANSKLNSGRSAVTDAKYWVKTISEDQALLDPATRKLSLG